MSSQPQHPSYPQYPAPVHPSSPRDDEPKANYDELIDQYASPYGNQPHKTYAVDPASLSGLGRQPSHSMSKHSYETSKDFKSLDMHAQDPPDWEYPPPLAKEESTKEEKSKWARVSTIVFPRTTSFMTLCS